MRLTDIQHHAIQARIASAVGAEIFDEVFASARYEEQSGNMLYVSAKSNKAAQEISKAYCGLVLEVASRFFRRRLGVLIILPKVLQ